MNQRRSSQRIPVSLAVEVHTISGVQTATVLNMSLGGVGMRLPSPVPVRSTLALTLFILEDGIEDEGSPQLRLSGKVVWCEPAEDAPGEHLAGIQFQEPTRFQKETLSRFLERINS